ncbi:MBL fold metallo-hydrolase [Methanothrix soehngenii]|jgi:ribonuclease Z|uniref:MBL fold metallo-hydrolase n=1 Tax=Methanothrix soehngenii TaxID=2223 RepID=UPI0023F0C38B|nr:MBL fold metallo-hydrolase [Methanothrix soehngenii]MCK9586957.1 MBL fold metallo-hydrolase [Methanothrix soehngenii]MDD5256164.1 MBL fold metallo-hydrolase [Methanothrix soehngenii]MDD5735846.1 MBL fold metallo-hydrolase [Methanothrix soehngenii]
MSLKVTLLGTGVGIPQPGRSQAAILIENDLPLLLDCGAGTLMRLDQVGAGPEAIDTVVLSHLHLDHVHDLLALANGRYLSGLQGLSIFGPAGTREWFESLQAAYPNLERMESHVQELKAMDSFSIKGFDIFAEEALHSVTALAYRLEAEERVIVYSGDTEPSARVAALADGSDLLIHECSFPEPFDVTNHTTPLKLGNMLSNHELKRVVLTHLYPQAEGHEDEMAQQVIELSGAPTIVGWDMMIMEI